MWGSMAHRHVGVQAYGTQTCGRRRSLSDIGRPFYLYCWYDSWYWKQSTESRHWKQSRNLGETSLLLPQNFTASWAIFFLLLLRLLEVKEAVPLLFLILFFRCWAVTQAVWGRASCSRVGVCACRERARLSSERERLSLVSLIWWPALG